MDSNQEVCPPCNCHSESPQSKTCLKDCCALVCPLHVQLEDDMSEIHKYL